MSIVTGLSSEQLASLSEGSSADIERELSKALAIRRGREGKTFLAPLVSRHIDFLECLMEKGKAKLGVAPEILREW